MSLYAILLLATASVPVLLSFDKRLHFYTRWKFVFPSLLFIAAIYIFFDVIFTQNGVWGFNPAYISGINLFGLPLEEVLFFIAVPYASIFLHEAFIEYFPNFHPGKKVTVGITVALIIFSLIIAFANTDKTYTSYIFIKVAVVLILSLLFSRKILQSFYVTFLIILIPFVIVNGVLTGTGINSEIVWYNNAENLSIRFLTIPVEDFGYAFSLILYNLITIKFLSRINTDSLKQRAMNLILSIQNHKNYVILFYIIFYLVGIAGLNILATQFLFQKLIPFALLLSAGGLLIFHEKFETKTYIVYGIVFLAAFIVELIGVKTGAIFGQYFYGDSLGFKLINTPLIIGLNWLMLVYITASIGKKIIKHSLLQITIASLLMVGYDYILEHVAPQLDMWSWNNDIIPVKNYVAWFILAFIFHVLFRVFNLKTKNSLALFMFLCQTLFFLILWIIFKVIH